MTSTPTFQPSAGLLEAAYTQSVGLANSLLARDGQLPPALFLIGQPAQGQDFQTCRMAGAGAQAMRNFHASEEALSKLPAFIRASLTPSSREYAALLPQIGPVMLALHLFPAALSVQEQAAPVEGSTPLVHPDGRQEYLVVALHTSHGIDMALCPLLRDGNGQIAAQTVPLELLHSLPQSA